MPTARPLLAAQLNSYSGTSNSSWLIRLAEESNLEQAVIDGRRTASARCWRLAVWWQSTNASRATIMRCRWATMHNWQ